MRVGLRVIGVTLFALMVVALTSAAAYGQGVDGGCSATVNEEDPSALTEDDPLKVEDDDTVDLVGTVPPDVSGNRVESKTEVYVIVAGFRVPVEDEEGSGEEWGDTIDIPNVIADLAPGIYRVEGEASSPAGGWNCEGSAYVDVDGGPFTAAAAVGAGVFVVGALLTDRGLGRRRRGAEVQTVMAKVRPALGEQVPDLEHDPRPGRGLSLAMVVATAALAALAALEIVELPESLLGATAPAAAGVSYDRVWLRGRPVGGFFGGLLMGLGIAVVLHQLDVWPLDTTQGLAFPLATGVLWAIRGWIGRAFLVVPTTTVVERRDEDD
jgi:hypothetical protein